MIDTRVIVVASVAYLALLFGVASWADRRTAAGRSVIASGTVYALSLTVYATSWTFYGSVGRAAETGVGFLPIYLGPTLTVALVVRAPPDAPREQAGTGSPRSPTTSPPGTARAPRSARSPPSSPWSGASPTSPSSSRRSPPRSRRCAASPGRPRTVARRPADPRPALYVALLLAAFTIVFGTRHLDATERHEGMVAAIAVESFVKLVAFLTVGVYVTFGMFGGFGDLFGRARSDPDLAHLLRLGETRATARGSG